MTPNTITNTLDSTNQLWGYNPFEALSREQYKNTLQLKMSFHKSQINYFKEKYGLSFEQFCSEFDNIKNYSIPENEDDSIQWETTIDFFQS